MTDARPLVERVVSVRRMAYREVVTGLVISAALLTVLMVVHTDWKVAAAYGGLALLTGCYTVLRTVVKFRSRFPGAEPLPNEAVEVAPPARELTLALLYELVWLTAVVALLVAFSDVRWVIEVAAGLFATWISFQFVKPLVEAHLISRWERSHGRLFRPVAADEDDDDDGAGLYVAERPVPAA
jgi:F0F1-type ATP synthase assembly protein I